MGDKAKNLLTVVIGIAIIFIVFVVILVVGSIKSASSNAMVVYNPNIIVTDNQKFVETPTKTPSEPYCGDKILNNNEECDGTIPVGVSCTTKGFDKGSVTCSKDCTLNYGSCIKLNAKCTDTDDGINYNIKGIVSIETTNGTVLTFTDYCRTSEYEEQNVLEYYCNDTRVASINHKCPWECDSGRCQ